MTVNSMRPCAMRPQPRLNWTLLPVDPSRAKNSPSVSVIFVQHTFRDWRFGPNLPKPPSPQPFPLRLALILILKPYGPPPVAAWLSSPEALPFIRELRWALLPPEAAVSRLRDVFRGRSSSSTLLATLHGAGIQPAKPATARSTSKANVAGTAVLIQRIVSAWPLSLSFAQTAFGCFLPFHSPPNPVSPSRLPLLVPLFLYLSPRLSLFPPLCFSLSLSSPVFPSPCSSSSPSPPFLLPFPLSLSPSFCPPASPSLSLLSAPPFPPLLHPPPLLGCTWF